jgi:alpha-D-xyloside xylohydrolase
MALVFERCEGKLIARGEGEIIQIEPWGKDCLRFRSTKRGQIEPQDWTLLPQENTSTEIMIEDDKAIIKNGELTGEITRDGRVRYLSDKGVLLEELWIDHRVNNASVRKARNYRALSSDLFEVELYFKAFEDEKLYGMGQYANGFLNLKGCVLELAQKNTQISVPFLLSSKGYGFIWNNPSVGRAELVRNHTCWVAKATKQIDYLIIHGKTPGEILQKYMNIVGKPSPIPEWALGLWQCKLRYRSQEELLEVARGYKERGIPLSVIVIDFFHWPHQGDWKFDEKFWPNPEEMVEELEKMGVKLLVSFWPTVEIKSENYREMVDRNLLVRTEKGVPTIFTFRGITSYVDFTNPEARKYVWEKVKENYYKYGIKMFWLDEAEPELGMQGFHYENTDPYFYENLRYHIGNGLEVSNIYPFYYAKAFYDGLREEGETEIVNLIRCAWLGSQRLGVVVWSGDIPSTFDSLRRQVKAGLNISLTGIFWWTTDIGGFHGGDPNDPEFRELLVRWFQFGVFCPVFRLHGFRLPYPEDPNTCSPEELTGGPNELWSYGEEVYNILKEYVFLRERMKPYIVEQMKLSVERGIPLMRPLFVDFPDDPTVWEVEDEYMFGSDVLVAPVLEKGMRTRKVYLPRGVKWLERSTEKVYEGGQWVEVETPLEVIPVFFKGKEKIF